ncbi:hypothetical protein J7L70_07620 [Candidatus Bathyarchaeota archaeon]|nr:hypothetical protein [Candidatus Bathyarchaeota archaeon]
MPVRRVHLKFKGFEDGYLNRFHHDSIVETYGLRGDNFELTVKHRLERESWVVLPGSMDLVLVSL